jgi:hypothetical protein
MDRDLQIVHYDKTLDAIAGTYISQSALAKWREQRFSRHLLIDEAAQRLG